MDDAYNNINGYNPTKTEEKNQIHSYKFTISIKNAFAVLFFRKKKV